MRCRTKFAACDCTFTTDVPKVFGGEGEYVSPGDMLAATVASCMLSMAGLTGKKLGFETKGITAAASCAEENGKIACICVDITVPQQLGEKEREALKHAVAHCPVGAALGEHVRKEVTWHCGSCCNAG